MAERLPPRWSLISVLVSSIPLTPALAVTLHEAAHELYLSGGSAKEVAGDILSGSVRNLRKELLLGTIGGPAFEAQLETARGPGRVRFILTREGLGQAAEPPAGAPRYLN